jgi:uncharacterized membrane protein
MFSFFKHQFLSKKEISNILECIRENESHTSGEIRICIESRCSEVEASIKAKEIFHQLKMYNTKNRNAVLIYIAFKDKVFALHGDRAIFEQVESSFWENQRTQLATYFSKKETLEGMIHCINNLGNELKTHFPSEGEQKNELPDEIIFGK